MPEDGSYVPLISLAYPGTFNSTLSFEIASDELQSASGTVFLLECSAAIDANAAPKPPRYFGVDLSKSEISKQASGEFVLTTKVLLDAETRLPSIQLGNYLPMYATLNFTASNQAEFEFTMALAFFTGTNLETDACLMSDKMSIVRSPD